MWLSRRDFLRTLYGGLAGSEQEGRVQLLYDTTVTAIELVGGNGSAPASSSSSSPPIVVHATEESSGRTRSFAPRLLVGADGLRSEVRQALQRWAPKVGRSAEHFTPVLMNSPAAGLKFKVLSLPPNPPFRSQLPNRNSRQDGGDGNSGNKSFLPNSQIAVVVGVQASRRRTMRLGLLPIRCPTAPRTANVIAPEDHEFWSLTTGKQLGDFLQVRKNLL